MQARKIAPRCPVCGHDGSRVLKQNSPVIEFLPPDLNAPLRSKRQCEKCKTSYFPAWDDDDRE